MKRRLVPDHLAMHLHRPLRFGSRMRGHELLLRIGQLILIGWLAVVGAKLIAQVVAGLVS